MVITLDDDGSPHGRNVCSNQCDTLEMKDLLWTFDISNNTCRLIKISHYKLFFLKNAWNHIKHCKHSTAHPSSVICLQIPNFYFIKNFVVDAKSTSATRSLQDQMGNRCNADPKILELHLHNSGIAVLTLLENDRDDWLNKQATWWTCYIMIKLIIHALSIFSVHLLKQCFAVLYFYSTAFWRQMLYSTTCIW